MKINQKKGVGLVVVLIIMTILSIVSATFVSLSYAETKQAVYQDKKIQAYYLAKSGADSLATYIMRNPKQAQDLVGKLSEDNSQFPNGKFNVNVVQGATVRDIVIESTGNVDNVTNEVGVLLSRLNSQTIVDKAIYSNQPLDITGMNVDGDVQSGGSIQYSTNGSNAFYDKPYPNAERNIELGAFPVLDPNPGGTNIVVKNSVETILQSNSFSSISIEQNGKLQVNVGSGVINLVVDNLIIDNILEVNATGEGRLNLFITNSMKVTTKGQINTAEPHNLFIYIQDGKEFEIQANMILNGYIIGPKAIVDIQSSQSTINGAVIANVVMKNSNGNGANGEINYVPLPKEYEYGDFILEYRIVKWNR